MTLGSHQKTVGDSQSWITPKFILNALGQFDLDPCECDPQPWLCALQGYNIHQDGLSLPWRGRVYLNPPFDRYQVGRWITRLAEHGNGTALLHARTEAEWFAPCWKSGCAMLFLADRLYFHYPDGIRAEANSGAPAVLVAFSPADAVKLAASKLKGYYVSKWCSN